MKNQMTHLGTQSMCALYKPESIPPSHLYEQQSPLYEPTTKASELSSNSGSEAEWGPEHHTLKHGKISPEHSISKVRDKSRALHRRWRQKFKVSSSTLLALTCVNSYESRFAPKDFFFCATTSLMW